MATQDRDPNGAGAYQEWDDSDYTNVIDSSDATYCWADANNLRVVWTFSAFDID